MGCESLRVSCHSGYITCPKNISCGERVSVCACTSSCVCVWLTTNGVVVRHQVLSPVWGSNTCQMEHGGYIQQAFRKIVQYSLRYMLLSCVRTSYQMAGVAGFSSLLWCINAIYYKLVFISTIPFSSTETILSAEMSLGHRFYFSYGSFCSWCNEASHFKRLPFGICQPLASEAFPLPSSPFPPSQLCQPLSSSVSVAVSIHQNSIDWHSSYSRHMHAPYWCSNPS